MGMVLRFGQEEGLGLREEENKKKHSGSLFISVLKQNISGYAEIYCVLYKE